MTVHRLKTDTGHFQEILDGRKLFEVRLNDRRFGPDDTLVLQERNPQTGRLTGRELTRIVTHVVHRVDRYHDLSQIEQHGLTGMAIAIPTAYEGSSQNPHLAAGERPPDLPTAARALLDDLDLSLYPDLIRARDVLENALAAHHDPTLTTRKPPAE